MERTPYSSARHLSAIAAGRSVVQSEPAEMFAADRATEARAKRVVNAVATLRILVPVGLITAIVISGTRAPDAPIESAMAAIAVTTPVADGAPHYFPAQYVNKGLGGEEHVQNF